MVLKRKEKNPKCETYSLKSCKTILNEVGIRKLGAALVLTFRFCFSCNYFCLCRLHGISLQLGMMFMLSPVPRTLSLLVKYNLQISSFARCVYV